MSFSEQISTLSEEAEIKRQMAQKYIEDFPNRIEKIKKAYMNLTTNPAAIEHANEIEACFQDIFGSAGTFGFEDLSDYAALVLNMFYVIKQNNMAFNSKILELMWQSIKYLELISAQLKRGKITLNDTHATIVKLKTFESDLNYYKTETDKSKILLVDDDPDILRLVEVVLKRAGYEVVTVKSGSDALNYLQKDKPKMIILDVAMPDMNGFEVLSQIRSQENLKSIPVMMLTARSQKEEIIKAIQMGAQNYMIKPFDSKELINRVKKMLGEV